jgi:hypothetical protein
VLLIRLSNLRRQQRTSNNDQRQEGFLLEKEQIATTEPAFIKLTKATAKPPTSSKMLPFLLATLLLTTTTTTLANPLVKRNIGGIRLCDQTNWAGNCWYGIVPLNDCFALNSLYVFFNSASGFDRAMAKVSCYRDLQRIEC